MNEIEQPPIELNIPDWRQIDKWVHTVLRPPLQKPLILFLRIEYDRDCDNPTEDTGFGNVYSFSRKHINFLPPDLRKPYAKDPDVVLLSYYEHGQSLWFVDGVHKGVVPDRQWDCVQAAGYWVPDKNVREECPHPKKSAERKQWMRERAESCCEVYSEWCNGQCYRFELELYALAHDEAGELHEHDVYEERHEMLEENACSGFIGLDAVLADLKETAPAAVQTYLSEHSKQQ